MNYASELKEFCDSRNADLSQMANRLEEKRKAAVAEHESFMEEHRRQFELVQSHAQNALDKKRLELAAIEARHNRLKASLSRELDESQDLLTLVVEILEG